MSQQLEMVEVRALNPDLMNIAHVESWVHMTVTDDGSERLCGERMNLLYQQKEKLQADRDSVVKPLRAAIKAVDDLAKPILLPLATAYGALNLRLGMYLSEKKRREEAEKKRAMEIDAARLAQEAERKADAAIKAGDDAAFEDAVHQAEFAAALPNLPIKAPQKTEVSGGAKFVPVTRWKARVVNDLAVPREYLMVNEEKLQRLATALKAEAIVPGVEFYSETTTARRT